ncbi:MAG TPA: amidase family protein, partial [Casimicrobiaceae bacterium]|nr:amidase family protein [Casimicrobiaceae bacterium]
RLDATEPRLHSFVTVLADRALRDAKQMEMQLRQRKPPGPLAGVPISVKDLIAVGGAPLTFGSRSMADNVAPHDAVAVERLRDAGAIIIGKTTTSEFGCKAVGDSPLTGSTRNPWDLSKTAGGSSAGAAASVAAGVTSIALGTDGGGSIRIPAAMTGLFGVKAQFGRVPVFPVAANPTLAHVCPIGRDVRDVALLLGVLSGYDARDPHSVPVAAPDYLAACDRDPRALKIAWSPSFGYAAPDAEVCAIAEAAVRTFTELGCVVEEVDAPLGPDPAAIWTAEFYAGVAARLAPTLRERRELLDPEVATMVEQALTMDAEAYGRAVQMRYVFREKVRKFFGEYDLLLSPTLPVAGVDVGVSIPQRFADRNLVTWVSYTYPFNLTGQPAASIPGGFTRGGLPVGLQLVARAYREEDLFAAAAAFETARPWAQHAPRL